MRQKEYSLFVLILIFAEGYTFTCPGVQIVSRAQWGARPAKWVVPINKPVKHVFIAHTVTAECYSTDTCSLTMRAMQNHHMGLGWSDIGFTWVVGSDGKVYEGVGWDREGVHTYGWNAKSYGIAFVGDFRWTTPNERMVAAGKKLIICGIQQGFVSYDRSIHGARDGTCTESPGDKLYEIIKKWPSFQEGPLPGYKC